MANQQTVFNGDLRIQGAFSAKTMTFPTGAIINKDINPNAAIDATKVIHQHAIHYDQALGADVVAQTRLVHTFRGDADIVAVDVVLATAPTGGDKALTVDVKLGNESTAFATILTGTIAANSTHANREVIPGTLTTTTAAAGDTLEIVVAVSGSTGSQGQGLCVTVWIREIA